jgi:hypothetical protein
VAQDYLSGQQGLCSFKTWGFLSFVRPHKTLTPKASIGVTPAMASGINNHIWSLREIITLVD